MILGAGTFAQSTFSAVAVGLPALAPALRSHYRLSLGETGVVLGAIGFGQLPALLPWGLLADRIGERLVITAGLGGAGGALVAAGATHGYASLVGLLVPAGALGASVNAASGRAVMGWFGAEERGFALGVRQTAIPIGAAAAAATLPLLASSGGTRLAFVVLGCACCVGAASAAVLLREPPDRPGLELGDVTRPIRDRRMWFLAGGSALYVTGQIAITTFVVLFLHQHRGLSAHAAAAALAVVNVLGIGARIGAGRWSDHLHARLEPLRRVGTALTVALALVAALVDAPLGVLIPALVVAGVLGLSWNGLSFTAAAETAGPRSSGAAIGFQQTMLALVGAPVPPVFAAIVGAASWRVAFALATLGPALGVLALRRVPETTRAERRLETSAFPPAAR